MKRTSPAHQHKSIFNHLARLDFNKQLLVLKINLLLFFFIIVVSGLLVKSEGEGVNQASSSVKRCVVVFHPTGDGWTDLWPIRC